MTYDLVFTTVQKDLGLGEEFFKSYRKYDDDAMLGKIEIPEIWRKVCTELQRDKDINYDLIQSWVSDYRKFYQCINWQKQ